MGRSRFNYSLHGLRGLAAVMVLIAHSIGGYIEHNCSDCSLPLAVAMRNIGTYGVEIFFFLSGYVIYLASLKSKGGEFFLHRFWRIYPIFILFTLLYFVLNHFIQIQPERDDLFYLASNILFLNLFLQTPAMTPNAWSITYEIWYYIITFSIIRPFVLRKNYIYSILGGLLGLYFIIVYPISFYYLMGVLVSAYVKHHPDWNKYFRSINVYQIIALTIIIIFASTEYKYNWGIILTDYKITLLWIMFSLFMLLLLHPASVIAKWLVGKTMMVLGSVSYTLYLAHPYSYLVSRKIIETSMFAGTTEWLRIAIFVILNIIFTSILVFIVYKYVERGIYRRATGKDLFVPIKGDKSF